MRKTFRRIKFEEIIEPHIYRTTHKIFPFKDDIANKKVTGLHIITDIIKI